MWKEVRHYRQEQPDDDHEPLALAADFQFRGPKVYSSSAEKRLQRQRACWNIYGCRVYPYVIVTRGAFLGFSFVCLGGDDWEEDTDNDNHQGR